MEQCVNVSRSNLIINGSSRRRAAANASINIAKRQASNLKKVSGLLRKKRAYKPLTEDQEKFLLANAELVEQFYKRREKRAEWQMRQNECEDSPKELDEKCCKLAQVIHDAEFLVVYTGAGISTAASIPDYRGPNGIWTRLQKGKDIGNHDLTTAEPTLTHMALAHLHNKGIVRHVVSQNCDGLHVRSGIPKTAISEVHGNMYIEVCKHCVPAREYVRTFDVTEKTSTFKHTTGRRCYRCGEPLVDTIVHFGERGRLRWPLNWQGACQAAKACDTILCLGSSLKVLRKYTWLWQTHRPLKRRPKLFIVNLQWTPKDKDATLKINGKCDDVMKLVMEKLGFEIPEYKKSEDPIFHISTPLHNDEMSTFTQFAIEPPSFQSNNTLKTNSPHSNFHSSSSPRPKSSHTKFLHSNSPHIKSSHGNSNSSQSNSNSSPTNSSLLNYPPGNFPHSNSPNHFQHIDEKLERLNSIVNSYKNVFNNLPTGVSATELLATLAKLEDISDEKEIKEEKIKEETDVEDEKDIKIEEIDEKFVVKSDDLDSKLEDKFWMQNFVTEESLERKVKLEDLIKTEELEENISGELKFLPANVRNAGIRSNDIQKSAFYPADNETNDDDDDKSNILPQSMLKSYSNKNESGKVLNFYGTGLCIRSTCESVDHLSNEDVADDTDSSESSVISDSVIDNTVESKNCEHNSDFLFISDDSLDSRVYNSVEKENYVITTSLSSPDGFNFPLPENGDIIYKENGEISMDECSYEFPSIKRYEFPSIKRGESESIFSTDFTSSDFVGEEGSYLLHTKVVDGIIHSAEVKTINVDCSSSSSDRSINGHSDIAPLRNDSDAQLKALWYKKFCGSLSAEDNDKKDKTSLSLSLELDDDVKRLWFWGFDTQLKKDKLAVSPSQQQQQQHQKRLTRSSYQKALSNLDPESVGLVCSCLVSNPQLCRLSLGRSEPAPPMEEEMVRARESFRRRRQHNYKKFEPVFEVILKSLTYERRKIRRSRKEEDEDEDELDEVRLEEPPETGDEIRKNGDVKIVPGWYGKGYRKIIKKKRNSL